MIRKIVLSYTPIVTLEQWVRVDLQKRAVWSPRTHRTGHLCSVSNIAALEGPRDPLLKVACHRRYIHNHVGHIVLYYCS